MLAGGCKDMDDMSALNPRNGLFDAKQIGRWEKEPLTQSILENLDVGAEETETEFASARDVKPEDLISESKDYVIGENDVVQASITDLNGPGQETIKTIRVSATGRLSLPLLPAPVMAKGLTEMQLEDAIKKAYLDAQVIKDAKVSATVVEARGRVYSVLGNVAGPGQYALYDADYRLLDALVAARDVGGGGQGVDYIYIVRKKTDSTSNNGTTTPDNATPTVKPGTDPLAPTSMRPMRPLQAMLMQEPGKASGDRVIVIDGKEVVIKGTDSTTTTTPAAPTTPSTPATPTTPSDVTPTTPTTPATPTTPTTPGTPEPLVPTTPATPTIAATAPTTAPFEGFSALQEPSDREVIRIPYGSLRTGQLKYNIAVHPGDLIVVPQPITGEYYMDGNVNGTGAYSLTARNLTLLQAVAASRGLNDLAWPTRTDIIRRLPGNKQVYVRVDLCKIAAGLEPDIYLKPYDRVNVGTNAFMPFIAAIRNGFRFSYGFGFFYDKNLNNDNNNNNNNN